MAANRELSSVFPPSILAWQVRWDRLFERSALLDLMISEKATLATTTPCINRIRKIEPTRQQFDLLSETVWGADTGSTMIKIIFPP